MDAFDIKNGEKLTYLFLIISPTLIGIVAVLLSFSADGEINSNMIVAMLVCFAIALYFTVQYKIHGDKKKKEETLSLDLKKGLDAISISENPEDTQEDNKTRKIAEN